MESKEKLFNQYKNMVNKIAWYYTKKMRGNMLVFEDLQAEGFLIFCQAVESFNPEIASFSTYLYTCLKNNLYTYVKKHYCKKEYSFDDILDYAVENYDQAELFFNESLQEISESGKEMLLFILSMDEKATFTLLQKYFVSTATFKKTHFDSVINQLKTWWKSNKNLANFPKTCQNLGEILENLG